jgi:hypothetical protein
VAAFAVATVNVGASGTVTATADTGSVSLPLSLTLCQTVPFSGTCTAPPSSNVTTRTSAGATGTFGVFVTFGGVVDFNPAAHRIFVRFRDETGSTRGSTSVAVRVQPDIRGSYSGSGSSTQSACRNPLNNGQFGIIASANITSQTNDKFSGTATASSGDLVDPLSVSGSVSATGQVTGTFTFNAFSNGFFFGSGDGSVNGQLSGNLLTLNLAGQFRVGESCSIVGAVQLNR